MSDLIGQQVGNYRIMRILGRGAFGEVYLGQHVYTEALVAIKMLHGHILQEPDAQEALRKFLQEAIVVARLEHRNIIRQLEYSYHNQIPYLVL